MKHGHSAGGTVTRTYAAWSAMKNRCDNPNNQAYENYGKRGISYCERWKMFENFLEDMSEAPDGLELERKDNEMGYSPENCIWDTTANQNRNRRDSVKITINGITKNMSVWCRENGIPISTYENRKIRGWGDEKAVTQAPEKQKRWITFNGETRHLSGWARELGISTVALWMRIKRMSLERALTMRRDQ